MSRDFEYEQNNIAYDEQYPREMGGGIKCKNYIMCHIVLPADNWKYNYRYLCMCCESTGCKELKIYAENHKCIICSEQRRLKIDFPAGCGHSFCVKCTKRVMFWDETYHHLSPVPYGCPPCPNGCHNPAKGKQCYCESYDAVQDAWKLEKPDKWTRWNEEQHESIFTPILGLINGQGECPLCRAKVDK